MESATPTWYTERNSNELISSDNATDEAVDCEFTPESTQYTPQDSTSENLTASSHTNNLALSLEANVSYQDLMTDLLESDFVIPRCVEHLVSVSAMSRGGEEPENPYPTTNYLGLDGTVGSRSQLDLMPGFEGYDFHSE